MTVCCLSPWRGGSGTINFANYSFSVFSPLFISTLCSPFTEYDFVGFGNLNLVLRFFCKSWLTFSVGMRGHAKFCRLGSDAFSVRYTYDIFIYIYNPLWLQVVVGVCVSVLCFVSFCLVKII